MQEYIIQDEPEYRARIKVEDFNGLQVPFLHLEFTEFTATTFKKLLRSWFVFRQTVRGAFFAVSNANEIEKWRKFVSRLGFEYYRDITCPDGKIRPCYVSWDTH